MKELQLKTLQKLWIKYKPRFKYFTTEDWKIFCYTERSWFRERKPVYDKYKLYNVVWIWGKKILRHRVIISNYIEQPEWKTDVNHKDWNKLNNRLDNLERCTKSHNILEAQRLWLKPTKKLYQFSLDWKLVRVFDSIGQAIKKYWSWVCNALRFKPNGVKYTTQLWYRRNTENYFPEKKIYSY